MYANIYQQMDNVREAYEETIDSPDYESWMEGNLKWRKELDVLGTLILERLGMASGPRRNIETIDGLIGGLKAAKELLEIEYSKEERCSGPV